jgi:hypothetical protein
MRYENNDRLREYLDRGAAGAYREHLRHPRFEFDEESFAAALDQVCAQFPELEPRDAEARAAFRLLTSGVAPDVAVPLPSRWYRAEAFLRAASLRCWPGLKLLWALAVLALCAAAVVLLSALVAQAEPTPQNLQAYRNAMRGVSLLAVPPQQPGGIVLQFQQSGSPLATRPAGLVAFNCSSGMSCTFNGTTFTLTSTGAGGSGCAPPGTSSRLLYDDGAGGCADTGLTWSGSTAAAPSGVTLTYSGSGIINARNWAGTGITNTESAGKIPIGNGDGTASWADPFVSGICAHDASCTSTNPVLAGGYASAAAPPEVSADGDGVRGWFLRNGSQVINLASGGTLVTLGQKTAAASLPVTIAGDQSAIPVSGTITANAGTGNFTVAQASGANLHTVVDSGTVTTVSTIGNLAQLGGNAISMNTGVRDAGTQRVTIATNDSVPVTGTFWQSTQPVSLAATVNENVAQINGVAVTTGNGAAGTGVQRVAIASDNSPVAGFGVGTTGSPVPANASYVGGNGSGATTGYLNCDNTAVYDAGTNGSTQLVALTSGQTIYVCGFQISTSQSTSVNVNLRYGTGTNCATGATNITPSYALQAAASTGPIGMVVMTPGFTGLKTAASNALCINTNAAVNVDALVWYTKF